MEDIKNILSTAGKQFEDQMAAQARVAAKHTWDKIAATYLSKLTNLDNSSASQVTTTPPTKRGAKGLQHKKRPRIFKPKQNREVAENVAAQITFSATEDDDTLVYMPSNSPHNVYQEPTNILPPHPESVFGPINVIPATVTPAVVIPVISKITIPKIPIPVVKPTSPLPHAPIHNNIGTN